MGYVLTSLLKLLTDAIAGACDMLGSGVLKLLTIDIGETGSLFGKVFGAFGDFTSYFIVISMVFLAINMFWQLAKIMFSPQESQDGPLSIVARTFVGGIMIYGSQTIILAFERVFNAMYKFFLTVEVNGASLDAKVSFSETITKLNDSLVDGGLVNLATTLLVFLLLLTMCWQFAMYIMEIVERYIVLGVLYYMSPLPCSMIGSRATSNIFGAYVRMVGSQLFLMLCNVIFFRIFLSGFTAFDTIITDEAFKTLSADEGRTAVQGAIICWALMMNGILVIGARVDSYLGTLGLSAAQTGRGLGSAVVAAGLGVRRVMSDASNVARGGYHIGKAAAPHVKSAGGKMLDGLQRATEGTAFGNVLSNARGTKASVDGRGNVTPGSIMNKMDGKSRAKDDPLYTGAEAANSVLKASTLPNDVAGGFDKSSFNIKDGQATMKWRDPQTGKVSDVTMTPLDKTNIDPSKAQGRTFSITDENGQKRDMFASATGEGAQAFAAKDKAMEKEMKEFAAQPGCTAQQVAPGVWHTTETNPETGAVTAKEYANANLYTGNASMNSSLEDHGSGQYHVSDISAPANGAMTVSNPAKFADGVSSKDFATNLQQEFGQGSSFQFSSGQAGQMDGAVQFTAQDGKSYVAAPAAMYDLSQQAQTTGAYRETMTAQNGAQYSVVEVPAGSSGKEMFQQRADVKPVSGPGQDMGHFATPKFTADQPHAQFLNGQNPYMAQAQERKSNERRGGNGGRKRR